MRIYNYLFYKTYILAKHSRNFDDTPVKQLINNQ